MLTQSPRCFVPAGDRNGEGAIWHAAHQAIYWTDVNRFLVHRVTIADGLVASWFFEEPVVGLVPTKDPEVLTVVLGSRVIFWEPASDRRHEQGFQLEGWPRVRLNEAKADPRGSLWVGSMQNNVESDGGPRKRDGSPDGILYRIDPDGAVSEWKRDIGTSNTLVWNPDHTSLYFADTSANAIRQYNFDSNNGAISGERPFFTDFDRGKPDGSAIDVEGYVWNCRYGGHCIVRVALDGKVNHIVEMPTANITTCTFGGSELRTIYAVTASLNTEPGDRLAGSVFAIESEVQGLPDHQFLGVPKNSKLSQTA